LKTALYIARRYLISKKSVNVINIISGISIAGVTVGTFALIAILSVFNGLEFSIKSMFSSFDPDIKITATQGKSFERDSISIKTIEKIPEIATVIPVIEGEAMLGYGDRLYYATIKGVPVNYNKISGLDSTSITSGRFLLEENNVPLAVVGQGVAYYLSVGLRFSEPIHLYAPKKGIKGQTNLANAFNQDVIYASGIFSSQQEIDSKYVFVPFSYAKEFFQMGNRLSSLEVSLKKGASENQVKTKISQVMGPEYTVKTQYEQHELFYKVMQSEKWAIFLILGFVLLIASFNILGTLSMLIIDKKADISVLQSLGANQKLIRTIFLFEGWLISLIGAVFGLILGLLVCWLQIKFGLLRIPNEGSFMFSAYPVEVRFGDCVAIFLLVAGIGFLAAWYPIRFITGKYINDPGKQ